MLKQIKNLLALLNSKAVDYQLDRDIWGHAIQLFLASAQPNQDYLIDGLVSRFSIDSTMLKAAFKYCSANDFNSQIIDDCLLTLHNAQLEAENLKITQFKARVFRLEPLLNQFDVQRCDWLVMIRNHEKQKMKYLTRPFIFAEFSSIKKIDYAQLVAQLSKETHPRKTKVSNHQTPSQIQRSFKKRKYNQDDGANPLIFASSSDNSHLHSPICQTGVRIVPLEDASPEKGYAKLKKTPGGSKVRPYFANHQGSFFKPITPYGTKLGNGMVKVSDAKRQRIRDNVPLLVFDRPEPISFTATLEQLLLRKNVRRRIGQRQLTHASCQEVFKAHGSEELITISGHDYHWSHLIAYFLGGDQSIRNLIPGTAVSNYNTLEIVEQSIAHKLTEKGIESIKILVQPLFSGKSLIPDELIFNLKWKRPESDIEYFEIININPRSYQRITSSMHKSIEFLRKIDDSGNELMDETISPPTLGF